MESVLDKISAIDFDKNESMVFGIKSGILWGYSKETKSISPLVYISKPKSISEKDFKEILDKIRIDIVIKK